MARKAANIIPDSAFRGAESMSSAEGEKIERMGEISRREGTYRLRSALPSCFGEEKIAKGATVRVEMSRYTTGTYWIFDTSSHLIGFAKESSFAKMERLND